MSTVFDLYSAIDQFAPFSLSMDFDNTGILVGDRHQAVSKVLLALDCTMDVVNYAKEIGAQLIITHHPVIFHPIKRVNEDSVVYHLIRSQIAVISAHTNLDIAEDGVNDVLAQAIGLQNISGLEYWTLLHKVIWDVSELFQILSLHLNSLLWSKSRSMPAA